MIRKIVQIGTPVLTQKSQTVTNPLDPKIKALIKDLVDTCKANIDGTAGLSAPQIGVGLRVCVCRRTDLEDLEENPKLSKSQLWEVMINPEIVKLGTRASYYWEGCLSIGTGPNALFGPVARPDLVKISYTSKNGSKQKLSAKGYFSHIIQHEIDHLNGILFLRYISNPKNIWKIVNLDKYLKEHDKYPPILG